MFHEEFPPKGGSFDLPLQQDEVQDPLRVLRVNQWPRVILHHGLVDIHYINWGHLEEGGGGGGGGGRIVIIRGSFSPGKLLECIIVVGTMCPNKGLIKGLQLLLLRGAISSCVVV